MCCCEPGELPQQRCLSALLPCFVAGIVPQLHAKYPLHPQASWQSADQQLGGKLQQSLVAALQAQLWGLLQLTWVGDHNCLRFLLALPAHQWPPWQQ